MNLLSRGKSSDTSVKTSGAETNLREDTLDAPLLSDEEAQENVSVVPVLGSLKNIKTNSKDYLAGALAVISVGSSIVAFSASPTTNMLIAGIFGCGLAPYGYYQQRQLTEIVALRQTAKDLDTEIDTLNIHCEHLMEVVDELTESVDKLEVIGVTFQGLTLLQTQSAKSLEKQVEKNREALLSMRYLKRTLILQNVLKVLIACEHDGDHSSNLCQKDIDEIVYRMEDIWGAAFKSRSIRSAIQKDGTSLGTIMESMKTALFDNMETDLFSFEEDFDDEENDKNTFLTAKFLRKDSKKLQI